MEVTNVLTYIGGYLINKLKKSDLSCEPCLSVLSVVDITVVEDSNLYIHLRAYSHTIDEGSFWWINSTINRPNHETGRERLQQKHWTSAGQQ